MSQVSSAVAIRQVDNPAFYVQKPVTSAQSIIKTDLFYQPSTMPDSVYYGKNTPGKPNINTISFTLGSKDQVYEVPTMALVYDITWYNLPGGKMQLDGGNHAIIEALRISEENSVIFEKIDGLNEWVNLIDHLAGEQTIATDMQEKMVTNAHIDYAPRHQGYGMSGAIAPVLGHTKRVRMPIRGSSFLSKLPKYFPAPLLKRWLRLDFYLEQPCKALVPMVTRGTTASVNLQAKYGSAGYKSASDIPTSIVYQSFSQSDIVVCAQTAAGGTNTIDWGWWNSLFEHLVGAQASTDGAYLIMTVGNTHVPFVIGRKQDYVADQAVSWGNAAISAALKIGGSISDPSYLRWVVYPFSRTGYVSANTNFQSPWSWLHANFSSILINDYAATPVGSGNVTVATQTNYAVNGYIPFNVRFTAYPRYVFYGDKDPRALQFPTTEAAQPKFKITFSNLLNLPYYEIRNPELEVRVVRPAYESYSQLIKDFNEDGINIAYATVKQQIQNLPIGFGLGQQQFMLPISERSLKFLVVTLRARASQDGDVSDYDVWNTPCLSQWVRAGLVEIFVQIGSTTYPVNGRPLTFSDNALMEQPVEQLRTLLDAFGKNVTAASRPGQYCMNYLGEQRAATKCIGPSAADGLSGFTITSDKNYENFTAAQIMSSNLETAPFDQTNFAVVINLQKFTGFLDGLDVTGTAQITLKMRFKNWSQNQSRPLDVVVWQVGEAMAILKSDMNRVMS